MTGYVIYNIVLVALRNYQYGVLTSQQSSDHAKRQKRSRPANVCRRLRYIQTRGKAFKLNLSIGV